MLKASYKFYRANNKTFLKITRYSFTCLTLARELLVQILKTLEKRFASLKMSISAVSRHLKEVGENQNVNNGINGSKLLDDSSLSILSYMDIGFVQPIKTSVKFLDGSIDVLKGFSIF